MSSSDGYASRLSEYKNKGKCGLPEITDSERSLKIKIPKLIQMMKEAKHIVVLTGAGISTSAGIPDFRGPSGIWTLEQSEKGQNKSTKNKKAKRKISDEYNIDNQTYDPGNKQSSNSTTESKKTRLDLNLSTTTKEVTRQNDSIPKITFENAKPTITHLAIAKLVEHDIIKYCITQNVDGLHRRSGLPRSKHAILHGCIFTEKCEKCCTEYFRDYDVGGISFAKTGRQCTVDSCNGDLRDTVLDWEDELPDEDWITAQDECEKSDLVICLGTSLRIEPAGSLPTLSKQYVIVNKQKTPYDAEAAMVIHAPVDLVMSKVLLGFNCDPIVIDKMINIGTTKDRPIIIE